MRILKNYAEQTKEQLQAELIKAQARIAELEANNQASNDSKFRNIIDASPVPYALNDDDQNITYLNPAFIETFGYDLDDIPTLADWWPRAYPDLDYQQWVARTWQMHLDKSKQTNTVFETLELSIHCKDGSQRTVLASAAPLSESYAGNHLVILYDITERKKIEIALHEQEKELIEIIDHLPSMIFLKEAKNLRYVRFNTAGEKLTGITRDEILAKNDYDFFPKEQADFFTEHDRIVLASGELEDIPDEPIETPQGTRSLHTRKVAINDLEGNPKYLLGISDDITEQKEAEAERVSLQHELQQVYKMESLGHLTGGIAHDFNNLLGIMSGFTELCLELGDTMSWEKLSGYLHQVQDAGERATSLVSQMLAFSRNDQIDNQVMALAPIVEKDIKLLRATLPSTLQIDLTIDDNLPAVMINPTTLSQVLMNLAINARDAMNGVGRLDICLNWVKNINAKSFITHRPIKGDWVELAVSDNGSGIDPAIINDIFTPFYTSKEIGKGTGMGLSVIYGIIKSCNGHILVESEVDKGSTFRMLFPPISEEHEKISDTNSSSKPQITGQRQEILIVDDEQSLALLIGEVVSGYGYQKTIVTDSLEAIKIFKEEPGRFSIVITDQTMPELTGMDLIAQLRKINPELPAILCSGYSDKVDAKESESQNISYFQKPVDTKCLILKIDELLNKN